MSDSFPMFTRCAVHQWHAYSDEIKRAPLETQWYVISKEKVQWYVTSKEKPFKNTLHILWWVRDLPIHQGALISIKRG